MKVLIVDDDRTLTDIIAFTLQREGFHVLLAHDGEAALRRWEEDAPDVILLDVNLPKLNGFLVCQRIRQQSSVPIIMLTVRGEEDDVVTGLDLGADDYITKPFSPRQLVARVHAVSRRAGSTPSPPIYQFGSLVFDPTRREVALGAGQPITLTNLENRLLDCLARNAGQVMPIDAIIDQVWGAQGGDRDMLRQLVKRLRGKIEADTANPIYIETVPGLGYGFIKPVE